MRKIAKLIVIHVFFLLIFLFLCSPFVYAKEEQTKRVLILVSYHTDHKWTVNLVRGVEDVLNSEFPGKIKLYTEYMDTKKYPSDEYRRYLYELYKYKYRNTTFDIIISADDNAFNFLRSHSDELFPETPVVFCGVNYFNDSLLLGHGQFTGVIEQLDMKNTVETALRLHPYTKRLVFITDTTTTGQANRKIILEQMQDLEDVEFIILNDLYISELLEAVEKLSGDSVVVYFLFYRDKSGRYFKSTEILSMISERCSIPIYGIWNQCLGKGIVGGKLVAGYFHGKKAAEMGMSILRGKEVDNIPVVKKSPNRYMFDYTQMKRWGIKLSDLPKDSIIINKPYSFYEENKRLIGGVIIVIVFQTLIIIGLVVYRLKRKQAVEALIQTKEQYRMVAEQAGQMTYDYNIPTGRISWSGDVPTITGFTVHEFQKGGISGWEKLIHPDDRKAALEMLDEAISKCSNYQLEYRFKHKDGTYIYVGDSGLFLTDKNGNAHQMLGIMKDITERKQAEEALKESEEQLKLLINSIPDLICFKDNMGRWVKANDAILEIFALKGKNWQMENDVKLSDITDPMYKEAFLVCDKSDKETWESGHIQIEEESVPTLDGKVQIFDMLKIPIFDKDKKKKALIVFGRDITKTKSLEGKLRKHKDHLEELVQERTTELQKTINLMAGREVRMAELKEVIKKLHKQVESAGMAPVADDPLKKI